MFSFADDNSRGMGFPSVVVVVSAIVVVSVVCSIAFDVDLQKFYIRAIIKNLRATSA